MLISIRSAFVYAILYTFVCGSSNATDLNQHPMSWIANVHMAAVGEGCHEPGALPSALGPRYAAFQLLCDQWSSREAGLFSTLQMTC